MNTRNMIATSVLALSAALPAAVMANPSTLQGDATTHVNAVHALRDHATRQEVLQAYANAVQSGQYNRVEGDASAHAQISTSSTKSRAEVLSELRNLSSEERAEINAS
ncbi:MAG TPA: hypothetical protein VFV43_02245 [Limnobacter sp.]|nr:hypothetical protein [Limnobacter sp.]